MDPFRNDDNVISLVSLQEVYRESVNCSSQRDIFLLQEFTEDVGYLFHFVTLVDLYLLYVCHNLGDHMYFAVHFLVPFTYHVFFFLLIAYRIYCNFCLVEPMLSITILVMFCNIIMKYVLVGVPIYSGVDGVVNHYYS